MDVWSCSDVLLSEAMSRCLDATDVFIKNGRLGHRGASTAGKGKCKKSFLESDHGVASVVVGRAIAVRTGNSCEPAVMLEPTPSGPIEAAQSEPTISERRGSEEPRASDTHARQPRLHVHWLPLSGSCPGALQVHALGTLQDLFSFTRRPDPMQRQLFFMGPGSSGSCPHDPGFAGHVVHVGTRCGHGASVQLQAHHRPSLDAS